MIIDTQRDLESAGLISTCFTCGDLGELEVRTSDVIIPVLCPECGGPEPAWIEGYDGYPDLLNDMREEDCRGLLRDK